MEDYVHRIGRTGRAGSMGRATSFYVDRDMVHFSAFLSISISYAFYVRMTFSSISLMWLSTLVPGDSNKESNSRC